MHILFAKVFSLTVVFFEILKNFKNTHMYIEYHLVSLW